MAAAIVSHEGHDYHASYALFERVAGVPEITIARILPPHSAESRLYDISSRDTRKPHSIPIPEPSPMGSVFFRTVPRGADACAKQAHGEGFRAECVVDNPVDALVSGDRLVGR